MMTSPVLTAVLASLMLAPCVVSGQRAPCYECEKYKVSHPHANPYGVVRSHCVYPCDCGTVPDCPPRVPVIMDGCGCCWQCAREEGEPCNGATLCDRSRNLTCVYNSSADPTGTCLVVKPAKCIVNNMTYADGDTFTLDCRTQCTCQNGTYACASLCPGETLPPSAQCHNPHLVSVPGQCCREWMCDTSPAKTIGPPSCGRGSGRWTPCSHTCGAGVSVRWTTDNVSCQTVNETRLCQLRPCQRQPWNQQGQAEEAGDGSFVGNRGGWQLQQQSRKHHIRRGHECKATQRHFVPVRLRSGWCISERRYRPKMCGECVGRCCTIHTATTITVPFLCPIKVGKGNRGQGHNKGNGHRYPRSLQILLSAVLYRNGTRSPPPELLSPSTSLPSTPSSLESATSLSSLSASTPSSSASPSSSDSPPSSPSSLSSSPPATSPYSRRRRSIWGPEESPFVPTSASSSVYDMMDEGQPRNHDRFRYAQYQYNHHQYDPSAGLYYYQASADKNKHHQDTGRKFQYYEHDPSISLEQLQEEEDDEVDLPTTTTSTTTWRPYYSYNNNPPQSSPRNDQHPFHDNSNEEESSTEFYDLPLPHEDLTVEDDVQYDWVMSGEYEVVQQQVMWIIRCTCTAASSSSSSSPSSSFSSSHSSPSASPCENWQPSPATGT